MCLGVNTEWTKNMFAENVKDSQAFVKTQECSDNQTGQGGHHFTAQCGLPPTFLRTVSLAPFHM